VPSTWFGRPIPIFIALVSLRGGIEGQLAVTGKLVQMTLAGS